MQSDWFWHIRIFQMPNFFRKIISFVGMKLFLGLNRLCERVEYQTTLRNDTRILNSFQLGSDLSTFPLSKTLRASSGSDLINNLIQFSKVFSFSLRLPSQNQFHHQYFEIRKLNLASNILGSRSWIHKLGRFILRMVKSFIASLYRPRIK